MFDNLLKAAVGVATSPVDVAADIVTMGGALTDRDEPYTVTKAKSILHETQKASGVKR